MKINKLIKIMERLRDPKNGCPWDKKQTMESIIPSFH
jgi:ATP diphosphatase